MNWLKGLLLLGSDLLAWWGMAYLPSRYLPLLLAYFFGTFPVGMYLLVEHLYDDDE